jgi:hypothetical protein
MRNSIVLTLLAVAALSAGTTPAAPQLTDQITAQDMLMNRPNRDQQDARFRMLSNGSGTVEFLGNPTGPQPVAWSLSGSTFCIDADEGLIASFDCATLIINGNRVTLAHTGSDSVASGVLVPR